MWKTILYILNHHTVKMHDVWIYQNTSLYTDRLYKRNGVKQAVNNTKQKAT